MLEFLKYIDIYSVDKKFNVIDKDEAQPEEKISLFSKLKKLLSIVSQGKVGSRLGGSFSMVLYSIVLLMVFHDDQNALRIRRLIKLPLQV